MPTLYWDCETYSQINLKEHGTHNYAAHPSTGIHFVCYAIDAGAVETWKPGDTVPPPFANPTGYKFVADNWTFENAILHHILIPRHGFVPIRIEHQDCAERLALANAFPAELGLRCAALGLPYHKDPEARRAMLRLSRPPRAHARTAVMGRNPAARRKGAQRAALS
jgi:hypothetical protein